MSLKQLLTLLAETFQLWHSKVRSRHFCDVGLATRLDDEVLCSSCHGWYRRCTLFIHGLAVEMALRLLLGSDLRIGRVGAHFGRLYVRLSYSHVVILMFFLLSAHRGVV